jgi:hypothetical protein
MDIDRSVDSIKLAWIVGILLAFAVAMLVQLTGLLRLGAGSARVYRPEPDPGDQSRIAHGASLR